jgi:hypothetical protein
MGGTAVMRLSIKCVCVYVDLLPPTCRRSQEYEYELAVQQCYTLIGYNLKQNEYFRTVLDDMVMSLKQT